MTDRNLLLVAYHFPPFGGSGVQRALKLARYLPEAGWRVHVLTAAHAHYPLRDESLIDDLGPNVRVHRVPGYEPGALAASLCRPRRAAPNLPASPTRLEYRIYWRLNRWCDRLRLPETEGLWIRPAVRAARKIIRRHAVRAVITTSPPHSIQRVGCELQRRLGIPWIADLRDPILDAFVYDPPTPRADRYWRRLEKTIISEADHVVVTCPDLAERLKNRYRQRSPGRFTTITNGYDPRDRPISRATASSSATGLLPRDRFRLGSVGVFYRAQTIRPLLEAVRAMLSARPDLTPRFELRIVGTLSAEQHRHLGDSDKPFLTRTDQQTHARAVAEMAAMDTLFLMTPDHPGGRLCIPAKTFEYLAFGGHILALLHPDTALERILREAGNATIVYHGDLGALRRAIESRFDRWSEGSPNEPRDMRAVRPFRRDALAAEYADLLNTCLERNESTPACQEIDGLSSPQAEALSA